MIKKINFSLQNDYEGDVNFQTDEIENFVPKIVDNLLKIDEIVNGACFSKLEFNSLAFDIMFVNDVEIHKVNLLYREKDCPTDVITFALFADDEDKFVLDSEINLGEILISLDTAFRQAEENFKNDPNALKKEVLTLITHGILHLFGFDHQTNEDYNFVVDIQNRILGSL